MTRTDRFSRLGSIEGAVIAAAAVRLVQEGHSRDAANDFAVHRLVTVADDHRASGASEAEVEAWGRTARAVIVDAMQAVDSLLEAARQADALRRAIVVGNA